MICSRYNNIRSELMQAADNFIDNFSELDTENQFIEILKADDPIVNSLLAKCIYLIFKCRIEFEMVNTT